MTEEVEEEVEEEFQPQAAQTLVQVSGSRLEDSMETVWLHSSLIGSLLSPIWDSTNKEEGRRGGGGALMQVR